MLGKIYLENNDNNKARAKKTNIIWCVKKKGTNCGILKKKINLSPNYKTKNFFLPMGMGIYWPLNGPSLICYYQMQLIVSY